MILPKIFHSGCRTGWTGETHPNIWWGSSYVLQLYIKQHVPNLYLKLHTNVIQSWTKEVYSNSSVKWRFEIKLTYFKLTILYSMIQKCPFNENSTVYHRDDEWIFIIPFIIPWFDLFAGPSYIFQIDPQVLYICILKQPDNFFMPHMSHSKEISNIIFCRIWMNKHCFNDENLKQFSFHWELRFQYKFYDVKE